MPKPLAPPAGKKQKTSPDYPLFVRKLFEASLDIKASKPVPGLYVVATPIGNLGDISLRALVVLASADLVLCEDTRTGGALLAKFGIKKPLLSCHDHNENERRPNILKRLAAGGAVALISDAGMPLIADPGYRLVRACREAGHAVTVIPGANAALTALAGSGLPTDKFHFAGFLPPKSTARRKFLGTLKHIPATLIVYETPQRLGAALKDLADILGERREAAVARELTKLFEETKRGTLSELAGFYAAQEPKGEIVIVIAPPDEAAAPAQDIDALLRDHLKTMSVRDAASAVSALTGIRKGEAYARALWLKPATGK